MTDDPRPGYALSAALVILDEIDRAPDMPKPDLLSLAVAVIVQAMDHCIESGDGRSSQPHATTRRTREAATRLAVRCRRIVQACLREEEWLDVDREFYRIIRAGLHRFQSEQPRSPPEVLTVTPRPQSPMTTIDLETIP